MAVRRRGGREGEGEVGWGGVGGWGEGGREDRTKGGWGGERGK